LNRLLISCYLNFKLKPSRFLTEGLKKRMKVLEINLKQEDHPNCQGNTCNKTCMGYPAF